MGDARQLSPSPYMIATAFEPVLNRFPPPGGGPTAFPFPGRLGS